MSSLGHPLVPSLGALSIESSTPGLEFLLTAPPDGDKCKLPCVRGNNCCVRMLRELQTV